MKKLLLQIKKLKYLNLKNWDVLRKLGRREYILALWSSNCAVSNGHMRQLAPNSSEMSASQSPSHTPPPEIPLEIISEEEMAIIEAAFAAAATRSLVSSRASASSSSASSAASFQKNVRSIKSITLLSKRSFSNSSCSQSDTGVIVDVEDSGRLMTQKRNRIVDSLLHRYRRNRGLTVTDITATVWISKLYTSSVPIYVTFF